MSTSGSPIPLSQDVCTACLAVNNPNSTAPIGPHALLEPGCEECCDGVSYCPEPCSDECTIVCESYCDQSECFDQRNVLCADSLLPDPALGWQWPCQSTACVDAPSLSRFNPLEQHVQQSWSQAFHDLLPDTLYSSEAQRHFHTGVLPSSFPPNPDFYSSPHYDLASSHASSSATSAFSPPLSSPSPSISANNPASFACMWAGCNSAFSEIPDLVNHVDNTHFPLLHSDECRLNHTHDVIPPSVCMWQGCTGGHTPSATPSQSSQPMANDMTSVLTPDLDWAALGKHLLEQHLGLPSGILSLPPPAEQHNYGFFQNSYHDALCTAPERSTLTLPPYSLPSLSPGSQSPLTSSKRDPYSPVDSLPYSPHVAVRNEPSTDAMPNPSPDNTENGSDAFVNSPATTSSTSEGVPGAVRCLWDGCDVMFASPDELTTHLADVHVGTGKKTYECRWDGCDRNAGHGKCLSSKQKCLRHLQAHTGFRPFKCSECNQYFSEAATLQQHMRRHTQEIMSKSIYTHRPFVCDFPGCGKAFAITGALTIHKRVHNGEKPFKCTYCDRSFAESSNLSKHLRTHTGARPYACSHEGCGKRFARPDQLSRHMGSVHKKDGGKVPSRQKTVRLVGDVRGESNNVAVLS